MYRIILFLSIAIIMMSGCNTVPSFQTREISKAMEDATNKVTYFPMQPANFFDYYLYFDYFKENESSKKEDKGSMFAKLKAASKEINEKKPLNERMLAIFPNETSRVYIEDLTAGGKVSYGGIASVSASGTSYHIVVDYMKSRTDNFGKAICVSGVGIRLRARIVTTKAGLDLSNLYGLGVAASKNRVFGSLEFETIGISGEQISSLVPVPATLSIESISAAMQALAAIKSKLYDSADDVHIWPQVLGTVGGERVENLNNLWGVST